MRALVPCARGHARHRWRSGCEVGRDLHLSVPTRNYTAENYHRSIGLCRFHATPCARSSHARADMHAAAGEVDAKLEETIYRSSVLPSTAPCQCVITQPIFFTDHFAFADSMPHHARARPMPVLARTCYLPRALPCPHAADRTDPAAVSAG
jgi:hypothetical protein